MNKDNIFKIVKWLWMIAVIIFIGVYFYQHLPEEMQYLRTIRFTNLILSFLLLIAGKCMVVMLAQQSVKRSDWDPTYAQLFPIITVSQLGKYIPGGVWHFAARISAYKENSLSNKKTAAVMIVENIWLVSGAFVFGLFLVALNPPVEYIYSQIKLTLTPGFWLVLKVALPVLWITGLVVVEKVFPPVRAGSLIKRVVKLVLIQVVIWLCFGSSFYFVFQDIGVANLWMIMGGYALSWMIGYLVIIAPGGIGVREFVLVALFSGLLPTSQIAIYSVIHRLIYTFVEVGLGGVGVLIQRKLAKDSVAIKNPQL